MALKAQEIADAIYEHLKKMKMVIILANSISVLQMI